MPCPSVAQNHFEPSKSFWSSTNHFGRAKFVLVGFKSFWTGPNYKNNPEKSNLNQTKMIWIRPKQFAPDPNNLYLSKTIWTVQNHFGPTEGQCTI